MNSDTLKVETGRSWERPERPQRLLVTGARLRYHKSPGDLLHVAEVPQGWVVDSRWHRQQPNSFRFSFQCGRGSRTTCGDMAVPKLCSGSLQVIGLSTFGLDFCRAGNGVMGGFERGSPHPVAAAFTLTYTPVCLGYYFTSRPCSVCGLGVWSLGGSAFLCQRATIT